MHNRGGNIGSEAYLSGNFQRTTILGNELTVDGVSDSPEDVWNATGIIGYEGRAVVEIPAAVAADPSATARFGLVVLRSVYQVDKPTLHIAHSCLVPLSDQVLGHVSPEVAQGVNVVISSIDLERLAVLNQNAQTARISHEAAEAEWTERSEIASCVFYLKPGEFEPIGRDPNAHYAQQIAAAHMVPNAHGFRLDASTISRIHLSIGTYDGLSVTFSDTSKHGSIVYARV